MGCGCGKSREERMAEREARAEQYRALREQRAAEKKARIAALEAQRQKVS